MKGCTCISKPVWTAYILSVLNLLAVGRNFTYVSQNISWNSSLTVNKSRHMVSKIGLLNYFMFVNYVSLCMSRKYLNQIFKKKWKPDKQTKNIREPRNMTYKIVHVYSLS